MCRLDRPGCPSPVCAQEAGITPDAPMGMTWLDPPCNPLLQPKGPVYLVSRTSQAKDRSFTELEDALGYTRCTGRSAAGPRPATVGTAGASEEQYRRMPNGRGAQGQV
jgi:hypothetical protein